MPGLTVRCTSAAAAASAAALLFAATGSANPGGPCLDVPFVGVCTPLSESPTPPPQPNAGDVFLPDTTSGIHLVN
jgi:hypothetical protein